MRCCKPNLANRKLEPPLHLLEHGEHKTPKAVPTLPSTRWAHLESSTLTERFQGRAMKENIVPQMFFVMPEQRNRIKSRIETPTNFRES